MDNQRRKILKAMAIVPIMLSAGLITKAEAAKWDKVAFSAKSVDDVIKAFGGSGATESDKLLLIAPEIAENGAVVRVALESKLAKTEKMAVIVEKNPNQLVASFDIPEGAEAFASINLRMAKTSNIIVLAKADGKWYSTTKEVKVTLGGCGG